MQLGEVASFIDGAVALRGAESALGLLISPMRRALWELFLRDHATKKLHLAESGALSDTTSANPSGARVSQLARCRSASNAREPPASIPARSAGCAFGTSACPMSSRLLGGVDACAAAQGRACTYDRGGVHG